MGKRGSVCVAIRLVCLVVVPSSGPGHERGGWTAEWHRVRGPALTGAEGRVGVARDLGFRENWSSV